MVEDDVENHFDARPVQGQHHLLELADLAARLAADGVAAVRGEERQRIVAPVVRPLGRLRRGNRSCGNSKTGISSTAVTPSDCRYGIFSISPRYVPGWLTPLDLAQVKPRTCIS